MNALNTEYLGDAVYAHYDGWGVELTLNSHENERLIYLEPGVLLALWEFWHRKMNAANAKEDQVP